MFVTDRVQIHCALCATEHGLSILKQLHSLNNKFTKIIILKFAIYKQRNNYKFKIINNNYNYLITSVLGCFFLFSIDFMILFFFSLLYQTLK